MEIQKGTITDAPTLEQLFSILYKPELKWSREIILEEIQTGEKDYYLALDDNETVGAFGIKFNDSSAKFGPLAIRDKNRKKGVGSKLLRFAEELAREKGLSRIWCYSFEKYNVANFYQNNGWVEEDFIQDFWDGQNCFVYGKEL